MKKEMRGEFTKFSHKTPHLKGKQHQLDPNLDLKQLVHHASVQYVDRDVDGDVDVYDNPKKNTPDENPKNINVGALSKKLIAKQKGEIKHTKVGMAYEENKSGDSSLHDWFSKSKSSDGKPGWVQLGGKYAGKPCAKQPGQTTKPKCGSSKMKRDLSKGEEETAFRRKNRKDPNPERSGKAINVATEETQIDEKCWVGYKQVGMKKKGKKIVPNCVPVSEDHKEIASGKMKDDEGYMAMVEFDQIERAVAMLRKHITKGDQQIPAWVQSKITRAADFIDTAAEYMSSDESLKEEEGKKDACYHKVKSRYKVWPSAYASGALVKCRKKGAANWGNKTEEISAQRYCPKCQKNEYQHECKYGPKFWALYSSPVALTSNQMKYDIAQLHPANEEFSEAIKIPAIYGNVLSIILTWRGKSYMAKMFFPNAKMPTRREVNDQIQKVYPGSTVLSYEVSKVQPGEPLIQVTEETIDEVAAWQRKEGKNKAGGLNEKGRKSYERENPGSDLKAPSKKVGNPRRKSFCARMKGMKKKLTSAKTANDPDSRINKSLRAWNC